MQRIVWVVWLVCGGIGLAGCRPTADLPAAGSAAISSPSHMASVASEPAAAGVDPEAAIVDGTLDDRSAGNSPPTATEGRGSEIEPPQAIESRTWRDHSGKFSKGAVFEAYDDEHVHLRRDDGQAIVVPFSELSEPDKDYVRMITRLDIPSVLRGVVNSVQSTRIVTVRDAEGKSHTVILSGVEASKGEAKKQLIQLVFRQDVEVVWYERTAEGWLIGEVYVGDDHINEMMATAALEQLSLDQQHASELREMMRVGRDERRFRAALARELAYQNWRASQFVPLGMGGGAWINGYYNPDGTYIRGRYR